jgi:predicted transcriptional regulator
MARRLHVLLDDSELREIQQIAQDRHMTTEQWVREALSEARRREGRAEDKLEAGIGARRTERRGRPQSICGTSAAVPISPPLCSRFSLVRSPQASLDPPPTK